MIHETVPHHARPKLRVGKLPYKTLGLLAAEKGIGNSNQKRQPLYALRSPVCLDISTGYTPDFFGIGFEKCFIQSFTETVDNPSLKTVFFRMRQQTGSEITEQDQKAFQWTQIEKSIDGTQGIIEEFPLIKDT